MSIRPPTIEVPLLKRLGDANFVPEPGIQSWLSNAYQAVNEKAIQARLKIQARKPDEETNEDWFASRWTKYRLTPTEQ